MTPETATRTARLPVIAGINFLSFLDTNLLIPMMALYVATLGVGPGIIGFIIGLYSIANTPSNILSGRLVDRFGYKWPMVAGLAGGSISMFFYPLAGHPFTLALVRVVHGVCGGMKSPAVMTAFTEKADESSRGRVMGFYGMSLAMANLVGFALSGVLVSRLGYTPLFYIAAGVLVLATLAALTLPGRGGHHANEAKPSFREDLSKIRGLLGRRGLQVAFLAIFAQYFAFGGVVTLLPLRVRDLGLDAFHVGMLLATFTVVFIILQYPSGILSDRLGRRKLINTGLLVAAVSLLLLSRMNTFGALVGVMAGYGVAFGLIFPSSSALVADNAVAEARGQASGIFHALLTAGVGIGAPVMGAAGSLVGIQAGLTLTPAIIILVLLAFLTVLRK